jgi:hypothetical protein
VRPCGQAPDGIACEWRAFGGNLAAVAGYPTLSAGPIGSGSIIGIRVGEMRVAGLENGHLNRFASFRD